ncbi:MAG: replication protein [Betaproteobacteria bacterium]|nr:replication protein [Betaproteobacteria bacterium]
MAIDTIRLKSPAIDESLAQYIESQCILRQAIDLGSGEKLYEITTGDLRGSWDSRIMIKVRREDYVMQNGRPVLQNCEPYLILECSVHKVQLGHNIYGGPTDFRATCMDVAELVRTLLHIDESEWTWPFTLYWTVQRVDWAEVYRLPFAAIQEFFEGIYTIQFPRRNKQCSKHGSHSIHIPGTTTTIKMYHKGPEFYEHDSKRLKNYFLALRKHTHPHEEDAKQSRWAKRRLSALQRLANNRLRVEVGINSEKFDYDFGTRPQVKDVTDDYLKGVHDKEIMRLLKEGKSDMETVRNNKQVSRRLNAEYGEKLGDIYYGFWLQLATNGEEDLKRRMKPRSFYRKRKALMDAGISWHNTDVIVVANDGALPKDFRPIRTDTRVCTLPARVNHAVNNREFLLKLAA